MFLAHLAYTFWSGGAVRLIYRENLGSRMKCGVSELGVRSLEATTVLLKNVCLYNCGNLAYKAIHTACRGFGYIRKQSSQCGTNWLERLPSLLTNGLSDCDSYLMWWSQCINLNVQKFLPWSSENGVINSEYRCGFIPAYKMQMLKRNISTMLDNDLAKRVIEWQL